MQERVECAGADSVTVMRELIHHGQPEDLLMRGVDKHVNSNEPVVELPVVIRHRIEYTSIHRKLPCPLSKFDI